MKTRIEMLADFNKERIQDVKNIYKYGKPPTRNLMNWLERYNNFKLTIDN